MPLITWNERYSVKIQMIDQQHQKLIGMINELNDAMREGKSKEIMGQFIQGLIEYAMTHFLTEEKLFEKYKYPNTEVHKQEHNKFAARVGEFKEKYDKGQTTVSIDVINFLSDWLINHIQGTDQKYSQFFIEKGLN